jgi:hypothetical protein
MTKDEIQKVTLGTNEALRVTADGEFIWHPEADAMIEYGDFTSSPAMRHILRALRKALVGSVQEPVAWEDVLGAIARGWTHPENAQKPMDVQLAVAIAKEIQDMYTTPPAAPDLQAELDATNRQVEILSDALAESRREVAALKAVQEPVAWRTYTGRGYYIIDLTFEEAQKNWPDRQHQPLYTTPPAAQRQWVGLTDEEMQALWDRYAHMEMMRAIEAKLKEKNT